MNFEGTIGTHPSGRFKIRLTADDWQLFTASMDCTQAAAALNLAAQKALNTGSPNRAWAIFREAQDEWMEYGAADTEPRNVFQDLMEEFYGAVAAEWR